LPFHLPEERCLQVWQNGNGLSCLFTDPEFSLHKFRTSLARTETKALPAVL